jgi:hypothetical protein
LKSQINSIPAQLAALATGWRSNAFIMTCQEIFPQSLADCYLFGKLKNKKAPKRLLLTLANPSDGK